MEETGRLRVTVDLAPEEVALLDFYQTRLATEASNQKDWTMRERARRAASTRTSALRFLVSAVLATYRQPVKHPKSAHQPSSRKSRRKGK